MNRKEPGQPGSVFDRIRIVSRVDSAQSHRFDIELSRVQERPEFLESLQLQLSHPLFGNPEIRRNLAQSLRFLSLIGKPKPIQ